MWHAWKINHTRKAILCVRCGIEKWKIENDEEKCPMGESDSSNVVSLELATKIMNGEI